MKPVEQVMNKVIQPVLEGAGFQRRKRTWNRRRGEYVDVVNVQTASYDRNTFTINVGVLVPELYEIVHGEKPARFVEEPDCVVRVRIGDLLNRGATDKVRDKWWELGSETEQLNCERELGDALPERVLPFLDGLKSMPEVRSFLEGQTWYRKYILGRLFLAAARHRVGDVEGAMRELADARPKAGGWADRVEAVQRALLRDNPPQRPV